MVSLVRMVALLLASMLAAPASAKKCDLPCAKAGTLDLGTVCKAVDYTLTIKTSETILPVVQDFTKTLKERINSTATVTCGGWAAPGSTIVCTVKDASGATNSSTNQIENMRRLALRHELEIGPFFNITHFTYTYIVKEPLEAPKASGWALVLTLTIFLVIVGPFCCFKLVLDESYSVVSDRDKNKVAMRIRRDKKERKAKAKLMEAQQ